MPFIELQTVDSTNNYALTQVHAGLAQHGLSIFAHEQTSGKGQRGKKWVSPARSNIALTIIIRPTALLPAQQFQLSACVAVAVVKLFKKYAGNDTKIKWPNDLYWKDRKAGGILIESVVSSNKSEPGKPDPGMGTWQWAIVGIGININQTSFPPELPNPVSLKQVTGKNSDPVDLAKETCRLFNEEFENLTRNGFENLYAEYLSHLYKRNEKVKLKKDNRVFEAMIKTVSPAGKLIIQHSIEEEFDFGAIEWVI